MIFKCLRWEEKVENSFSAACMDTWIMDCIWLNFTVHSVQAACHCGQTEPPFLQKVNFVCVWS